MSIKEIRTGTVFQTIDGYKGYIYEISNELIHFIALKGWNGIGHPGKDLTCYVGGPTMSGSKVLHDTS